MKFPRPWWRPEPEPVCECGDNHIHETTTAPNPFRRSTAELIEQMTKATPLTEEQLNICGIEVLHFIWSVHKAGGDMAVKWRDDTRHLPVNIIIRGMIEPKTAK